MQIRLQRLAVLSLKDVIDAMLASSISALSSEHSVVKSVNIELVAPATWAQSFFVFNTLGIDDPSPLL